MTAPVDTRTKVLDEPRPDISFARVWVGGASKEGPIAGPIEYNSRTSPPEAVLGHGPGWPSLSDSRRAICSADSGTDRRHGLATDRVFAEQDTVVSQAPRGAGLTAPSAPGSNRLLKRLGF